MKPLKVLLMMSAIEARTEVLVSMQQAGIAAVGCGTPLELFSQLASGGFDAAALDIDGLGEVGYALVARLSTSPSLGIVVLGSQLEVDNRLRCLQSGADACLSHPVDSRELIGVLMALARRLPGRNKASSNTTEPSVVSTLVGRWELRDQNWTLVSPNGIAISLSANERNIVKTLLDASGEAIARDALGQCLGDSASRGGSRSIDVIISRLRRKAEQVGVNLPIRTVYGSGYLFADQ